MPIEIEFPQIEFQNSKIPKFQFPKSKILKFNNPFNNSKF